MTEQPTRPVQTAPLAAVPDPGQRVHQGAAFALRELDPRELLAGAVQDGAFAADDVTPAGSMREHCPHCAEQPLQLVLRYRHVIRSHLYCPRCTRCFDALLPDGNSALTLPGLPID